MADYKNGPLKQAIQTSTRSGVKPKKILLVSPDSGVVSTERLYFAPPLGVMRLAGYLAVKGHKAEYYDPNLYACNGEDTDLDGSTGVCLLAPTGPPISPSVADCWTCVNDFSPTFIWASDTGDDLELARTSTQGKARWIVQYSELINFPLTGTSPNATWTNQTVTISVDLDGIISFPEIENTTVDININKTERD